MKCLVTGAAGGIGSHLCDYLLHLGHDVIGLDDYSVGQNTPGCTMWNKDIVKTNTVPLRPFDWVFHLAARADIIPSISHPKLYHDVNVTGTLNMLEYARKVKAKRFVYAASSSCYGIPTEYPTPESAPCNPQYPYALTKWMGEQYVLHYAKVYGLSAVSLRLFNVFGPNFRTTGTYGAVFGTFLAQLANGKPLTVVGDGTQSRDFTYVSDVCRAFVAAAIAGKAGEIFNVGTGRPQSVNKLVELLDPAAVTKLPKRPGEPEVTQADIQKIGDALNWHPTVTFEDGVQIMKEHLEEYKDAPLWDAVSINEATKDWFACLKKS